MINTVGPGAVNIFINRQAMSLRIPTKTLVLQGMFRFLLPSSGYILCFAAY